MKKLSYYLILFVVILIIDGCQNDRKDKISTDIKIISLAPHITEIIYALDAQDQLIAVTDFCKYPEEALKKEKIGGLLNPNIEKIVRLNPSHLFGLPSHEKLGIELANYGLVLTMMPNENISNVLSTIETIGTMIDRQNQAKILVNNIKLRLDSLKKRDDIIPRSGVLIIGREDGTLRNITVAGEGTYFDELWQHVGGINSYSDLPTRYGTINLESLLLRNPEVIIEFDMKRERGVYQSEISPEWSVLADQKAIKNKNIFIVGGNHTMIPGPRLVWLAEDFAEILEIVSRNQK